jgi:hypothetical protein
MGARAGHTRAGPVTESMRAAMIAQHLHPGAAEFSLGFTARNQPLRTFAWSGLDPASGFVADRLLLILAAACVAVLPAIWFGRFDPARARPRTAPARPDDQTLAPTPAAATPAMAAAAPAPVQALPRPAYQPLPHARRLPGRAAGRLLAGELRILVQGTSRWWWLVAAALTAVSLLAPANLVKPAGAITALLLSAAWIWPVLIWSRLGTQRRENGLETLLGAYPAVYRQLAAEWVAGLALTAVAGLGPCSGWPMRPTGQAWPHG